MSKDKMTIKGEKELAEQIKELSGVKWEPITFQSGPTAFITGVGKIEQLDGGTYSETFLETILPDTDEDYDDQLPRIATITEMVCKAVNRTYGQSINPDAVKDLRDALLDYEDGMPLSDCLNAIFDLIPADETGWKRWLKRQAEIIEAAINKSKL
jgi:hypothetical protein